MRWLGRVLGNWIYRFPARMVCHGGGRSRLLPFRRLSRRSGCVPALPYPPLSYFQSGSHQPRRAMIFHRTAITPLTFVSRQGFTSVAGVLSYLYPSEEATFNAQAEEAG